MIPVELNAKLLTLLGSQELVNKWWNSPNKAFHKECPRDAYQKDRKDIEAYIDYMLSF